MNDGTNFKNLSGNFDKSRAETKWLKIPVNRTSFLFGSFLKKGHSFSPKIKRKLEHQGLTFHQFVISKKKPNRQILFSCVVVMFFWRQKLWLQSKYTKNSKKTVIFFLAKKTLCSTLNTWKQDSSIRCFVVWCHELIIAYKKIK